MFPLLSLLTEIERHEGIVFLATNRPHDLDEAMHRRITTVLEYRCDYRVCVSVCLCVVRVLCVYMCVCVCMYECVCVCLYMLQYKCHEGYKRVRVRVSFRAWIKFLPLFVCTLYMWCVPAHLSLLILYFYHLILYAGLLITRCVERSGMICFTAPRESRRRREKRGKKKKRRQRERRVRGKR